jgi:ABC-type siderophore export system fused ATPase/permease subunit
MAINLFLILIGFIVMLLVSPAYRKTRSTTVKITMVLFFLLGMTLVGLGALPPPI